MPEMIVAVFDTFAAAEAAMRDIEAAALPAAVIHHYDDTAPEFIEHQVNNRSQSFWSWLFGEEPPTPERAVYDQTIANGGTVVTVTVDDAQAPLVVDLLTRHHPRDLDEQTVHDTVPPEAGAATSHFGTDKEAVIPLSEEQIEVGKRAVDRGTTRVRRYVVRTPVEQPVTLRDEQVTIERRRPLAPGEPAPEGAFEERTTEVHTTSEEPVVSKTPHVAEEVVVRKDAHERTETVHDTVRREQVDIEEDRDGAKPATPGGQAPLARP